MFDNDGVLFGVLFALSLTANAVYIVFAVRLMRAEGWINGLLDLFLPRDSTAAFARKLFAALLDRQPVRHPALLAKTRIAFYVAMALMLLLFLFPLFINLPS